MCKQKENMKKQKENYPCAEPQMQMIPQRPTEPHGALTETHKAPTWTLGAPMELPQSPTEKHGARRSFEENIPFSFKDVSIILIIGGMCT